MVIVSFKQRKNDELAMEIKVKLLHMQVAIAFFGQPL